MKHIVIVDAPIDSPIEEVRWVNKDMNSYSYNYDEFELTDEFLEELFPTVGVSYETIQLNVQRKKGAEMLIQKLK